MSQIISENTFETAIIQTLLEIGGYTEGNAGDYSPELGMFKTVKSGKSKPDTKLRDYENIPFLRKDSSNTKGKLTPQSIEKYFDREVKPHLPEAWIDEKKTKTGYEINFTKYFYKFKPLRPLVAIKADILALEKSSLKLEKIVLEN